MPETSRDVSFCAHTILTDEVMVVPDASADARFVDNPLVTGPPGIRFYTGPPLRTADAHRLGALCIADIVARPVPPDLDVMADLAAVVTDQLELRVAGRERAAAESRARQPGLHRRVLP